MASKSRSARWAEAVSEARGALDRIEELKGDVEAAFNDLKDIQSEYQDWMDNLPENLASGNALSDKLEAVTGLDLDWDASSDLDSASQMLDEADNADLPLGFGRD